MSTLILSFVIGYSLGSIPMAFLLVRRARGVDIRDAGSGNVGALNSFLVTRSALLGIGVLVFDVLKGALAVIIPEFLLGREFPTAFAGCIGAILGHNFSPWLRGKGGRGLATAAGALVPIAPIVVPLWILFWGLGYLIVREVNVGSAIACCLTLLTVMLLPDDVRNRITTVEATKSAFDIFFSIVIMVILLKLVRPISEYFNTQRRL
ncbi:MAG: glycerol-3-phosphate acyltransferase [Bacteroidota bacterium]